MTLKNRANPKQSDTRKPMQELAEDSIRAHLRIAVQLAQGHSISVEELLREEIYRNE